MDEFANCCGGNDERIRGHCTWCELVVHELYDVLREARKLDERATNKAARERMRKAIERVNALLYPVPRTDSATNGGDRG